MSAVTIVPTAQTDTSGALVELPPPPEACRNCGAPLGPPRPNYCGHCGQETHLKPPTIGEFLQQFPTVTREMAIQALEEAKESLLARIA